jgi:hypothetical protein
MNIAATAAAGVHAMSRQTTETVGQNRSGGHRTASISDIDAQGSSVATSGSATGKTGSKLDIKA